MKASLWLTAVTAALAATSCIDEPSTEVHSSDLGILPGGAICAGTARVTYTPGLRQISQQVTRTANFTFEACLSLALPIVTTGTAMESSTRVRSCLDVLASTSGNRTIEWDTGQTSVFTYRTSSNDAEGELVTVELGTITIGKFAGHAAISTVTLPSLGPLECSTEQGVTNRVGPVTFIIL
jgi:hypothetical protein